MLLIYIIYINNKFINVCKKHNCSDSIVFSQ